MIILSSTFPEAQSHNQLASSNCSCGCLLEGFSGTFFASPQYVIFKKSTHIKCSSRNAPFCPQGNQTWSIVPQKNPMVIDFTVKKDTGAAGKLFFFIGAPYQVEILSIKFFPFLFTIWVYFFLWLFSFIYSNILLYKIMNQNIKMIIFKLQFSGINLVRRAEQGSSIHNRPNSAPFHCSLEQKHDCPGYQNTQRIYCNV